jgi:Bifunctional DNA primase/polymerase, N-terminal/Primase C terminal 1 (PriCT-1)
VTMFAAAMRLASKGLRVFPVKERQKEPAVAKGCLAATIDSDVIASWWTADPDFNIGIACGPASGMFAIDIDGPDAEVEIAKLEVLHGPLPATVEVITPRPGRHLYFAWPAGHDLRNSAGKLAPGIDVRGAGGYVLAPPSVHPSGRLYCWSVDSASSFSEAPHWLLDKLTSKERIDTVSANRDSTWYALVRDGVHEGQRNESIAKLSGHLLRRRVHPNVVLELLQGWNAARCTPPLPERDVERIVDSIAARELKRRLA